MGLRIIQNNNVDLSGIQSLNLALGGVSWIEIKGVADQNHSLYPSKIQSEGVSSVRWVEQLLSWGV
jgi:hypothetical protein